MYFSSRLSQQPSLSMPPNAMGFGNANLPPEVWNPEWSLDEVIAFKLASGLKLFLLSRLANVA